MSNNLPILYPSGWQDMPDGRRLPVFEIGHLFPNYRPQSAITRTQQELEVPTGEEDVAAMPPLEDVAESQETILQQDGISTGDKDIALDASRKRPSEEDSSTHTTSKKHKNNKGGPSKHVPWSQRFEELKAYKKVHGDCNVPKVKDGSGPYKQLAAWLGTQRNGYKAFMKAKEAGLPTSHCSGMTEERIGLLEEIGFEWSVIKQVPWHSRFEELKEFNKKYGHCRVPQTSGKLGNWVQKQRGGYKAFMKAKEAGMPTTNRQGMTQERIGLLEGIGFEWSVSKEVPWDSRFEELKEFNKKYGHCRVPQTSGKLGNWVSRQRTGYRMFMKAKDAGEPTTNCRGMTQERIALLEDIGFEWSVSREVSWDSRYEELKEYKDKHGTCRVSGGAHKNVLGQWVHSQRSGYRMFMKAKEAGLPPTTCQGMTQERIRLLEEIGFEWYG